MKPEIIAAIKARPGVLAYVTPETAREYFKAAPMTRDELERKVSRAVSKLDRAYLALLESNGVNVPFDFWQSYEADLRAEIAAPLRQYIEQSFTNYSDYVNFVDRAGAVADIDTLMTRAITDTARGVAGTTRAQLQAMLAEGVSEAEIIERIAMRFGAGHAEQVAVTEITRAEGFFSEALSQRLAEQEVKTVIRWQSAEDEKVCPICGPADHRLKDDPIMTSKGGWNGQTWGARYGSPPAHPNCRCQTVVELTK